MSAAAEPGRRPLFWALVLPSDLERLVSSRRRFHRHPSNRRQTQDQGICVFIHPPEEYEGQGAEIKKKGGDEKGFGNLLKHDDLP